MMAAEMEIITTTGQSCRTRVLNLDLSRTRVRFLADLDLDSVVKGDMQRYITKFMKSGF